MGRFWEYRSNFELNFECFGYILDIEKFSSDSSPNLALLDFVISSQSVFQLPHFASGALVDDFLQVGTQEICVTAVQNQLAIAERKSSLLISSSVELSSSNYFAENSNASLVSAVWLWISAFAPVCLLIFPSLLSETPAEDECPHSMRLPASCLAVSAVFFG